MKFGTSIVFNGGAALGTDADPNTTAPKEDRTLASPESPIGASLGMFCSAQGGTSLIVQLWMFDPGMKRWQKYGSPLTVEADNVEDFGVGLPLGAKFFPQITTVTGATKAGFGIAQR